MEVCTCSRDEEASITMEAFLILAAWTMLTKSKDYVIIVAVAEKQLRSLKTDVLKIELSRYTKI